MSFQFEGDMSGSSSILFKKSISSWVGVTFFATEEFLTILIFTIKKGTQFKEIKSHKHVYKEGGYKLENKKW